MDVGRVAGSWVSGSRWSCEADHVVAALEMVAPVTDARLVGERLVGEADRVAHRERQQHRGLRLPECDDEPAPDPRLS